MPVNPSSILHVWGFDQWSAGASFHSGWCRKSVDSLLKHTGVVSQTQHRTKQPQSEHRSKRNNKKVIQWTVHHSATTKPGVECCESLRCSARERRIKPITWSCPRCTELSCPELSRREPSGPRCVWWPGQRGAVGGGWWWRSPVSSEVHGPRSGFSCRAPNTKQTLLTANHYYRDTGLWSLTLIWVSNNQMNQITTHLLVFFCVEFLGHSSCLC